MDCTVVIFHDEAPRFSYYFSVDGQQCILGHELSDLDLIRADVRATSGSCLKWPGLESMPDT